MTPCGFTYAHYREVLREARSAYAFVSFEASRDAREGWPVIALRHDVDFSPEDALALARLEAEEGIAATYLLLPHGPYNLLGDPAFAMVREIATLGHRLGVHYDRDFYARHGLAFPDALRREARVLEDAFGSPFTVAARHNPGPGGASPVSLAPLLDAYGPAFTERMKYVSDSCQFWREGCFCALVRARAHARLHVLVHAEWWTEDGLAADAVLERLVARGVSGLEETRRAVRRQYAALPHLGNRDLFLQDE